MKSPEYNAYYNARNRCTNPNYEGWKNYGGRRIEFRFRSFEEFFRELGPRPEGLILDRIDNDGHYEKGNVRWTTRSESNKNQRLSTEVRRRNGIKTFSLYGSPATPEGLSKGGRIGNHYRWHVERGIINHDCELCSEVSV